MTRLTRSRGDMQMFYTELNYRHSFTDRHYLDFTVDFHRWKADNDNFYQDSTVVYAATPSQPSATRYSYQSRPMHMNNRTWEVKLDYENPISETFQLQAGYQARFSHENTPQESFIDNQYWDGRAAVEDRLYFNRFIYDMDVHALYATATLKFGRFGVMGGLRGEYWRVNTESYTWDQEYGKAAKDPAFVKDYFQLFPSLFLNYSITETAQLQLNYTRRLRRPWGGQLNSFKNTRDATMVEFGNPLLTPEYTNSFSLNFLKTWEGHTLSLGTYYRPTTDVIQRIRYQSQTEQLMYMTNLNVAKSQSAGAELIVKNKLWRILDLTTTVNAYYYKLDGFQTYVENQLVTGESDENFAWDARLLASVILPYSISIQATGNYRSRSVITQGYRNPNGSLDLGIRKTFFNKTFAVALNWRDVFNTRKWENFTESSTFYRHQKNWRDPRINLQLTWNFGNMTQKKKPQRDDQQGSDDDSSSFGGYEQ